MEWIWVVAAGVLAAAVGGYVGLSVIAPRLAAQRLAEAETKAAELLKATRAEAETKAASIVKEGRDEASNRRNEADREIARRSKEMERREAQFFKSEEKLNEQLERVDKRRTELDRRNSNLDKREEGLEAEEAKIRVALERVAALDQEAARAEVLVLVEEEARYEAAQLRKRIEDEARKEANEIARKLIVKAVFRCAVDHYADSLISTVELKSDEMKGRIIGREGRNIRAIEAATGVDVIIDDTPNVVMLSSFDGVRREMARQAAGAPDAGRPHPPGARSKRCRGQPRGGGRGDLARRPGGRLPTSA